MGTCLFDTFQGPQNTQLFYCFGRLSRVLKTKNVLYNYWNDFISPYDGRRPLWKSVNLS